MSEPFNPYFEWLGVRSARPQPNFYELLRLAPFEEDPEAILTAANMQMAKVRGLRPGDHADAWRRLLGEIDVAKRILCAPEEKAQYDAELRESGSPPERTTGQGRRSPYMVVSAEGISNLLPPGFAKPKAMPAAGLGNSTAPVNPSGGERAPNSPAAAAPDSWIPAKRADIPWTPPSKSQASPLANSADTAATTAAPTAPVSASNPATSASAAMKPKLVFPGETVPTRATTAAQDSAAPKSVAPAPAGPVAPFAAQAPTVPGSTGESGGVAIQLPKPMPLLPLPGMPQTTPSGFSPGTFSPGQFPSSAMPDGALPAQGFPRPQPAQSAPGFAAFPRPTHIAQSGMPVQGVPGGSPGFHPQGASLAMPQTTAMPTAGSVVEKDFLDDVLSTSKPSKAPPIDELGIGDTESTPHRSGFDSDSIAEHAEGAAELSPKR